MIFLKVFFTFQAKKYHIDPIDHDIKWSLSKDIGKNKKSNKDRQIIKCFIVEFNLIKDKETVETSMGGITRMHKRYPSLTLNS